MRYLVIGSCIISALLFIAPLSALYSDDFPICAYGEFRNQFTNNYNNTLAVTAHQAGFNAVKCTAVYYADNNSALQMLDVLNQNQLDAIFEDLIFCPESSTNNEKYGYSALSTGVCMRFEAEYSSNSSVNTNDDVDDSFFYMSKNRIGDKIHDIHYSNNYYWNVPNDSVGYAFKDLLYRWSYNNNVYDRVGQEFRFLGNFTNGVSIMENNKLYIKFIFAVDLSSIANLPDTTPLAKFTFPNYSEMNTNSDFQSLVNFYKDVNSSWISEYILTKADYLGLPVFDSDTGRRELTFIFPLKSSNGQVYTLYNQDVVKSSGWYWQLSNLNPWMYWYGHGILKLDCIEYYDDIYQNYTNNPVKLVKLRNFSNQANLKYFYGVDEPKSPHFKSFRLLKDHLIELESSGIQPRRYLISASDFAKNNLRKPDNATYRLTVAYINEVHPRIVMIDRYPFTGSTIHWNNSNDNSFVQKYLNNVCNEYNYYRACIDSLGYESNLYCIPQTFGVFVWYPNSNNNSWLYLLPPPKMARCLQLLPLCYKADGIVSFKLDSDTLDEEPRPQDINGEPHHYALVSHHWSQADIVCTPQYYEVAQANRKIKVYAPIIKELHWLRSEVINTTVMSFSNISIHVLPANNNSSYEGYIQTGLYSDTNNQTNNIPFFMCVNRRTEGAVDINNDTLNNIHPNNYNSSYFSYPSQTIRFTANTLAHDTYGTYIGLYDSYSEQLYHANNDNIDVSIDPGDGLLLQMCGTLPPAVNSACAISKQVYLDGDIVIGNGGSVDVAAGTKITFKKNCRVTITTNGSFTIRGEAVFEDSSFIYVSAHGQLIINTSSCLFGNNSGIKVIDATITINGSVLDRIGDSSPLWLGIQAISSHVNIYNSSINHALNNTVQDSNLSIAYSSFLIAPEAIGLIINNSITGLSTSLIGNPESGNFYGESNTSSNGIIVEKCLNAIKIKHIKFHNLSTALNLTNNTSQTDSIISCSFSQCHTGIRQLGPFYTGLIDYCIFTQNNLAVENIASSSRIQNCTFSICQIAIRTDMELTTIREAGIYNNNFLHCEKAIECGKSSTRLQDNYFYLNNSGIVCHLGSNLNLCNSSNNLFYNRRYNIRFFDSTPYRATIQLYCGHNDFYHYFDQNCGDNAYDFTFDDNYYHFDLHENCDIDATGNWFKDDLCRAIYPDSKEYVIVKQYDTEPNLPTPPPENNRFFFALENEKDENYVQALLTYQAILNDSLQSEQCYLNSCLDGVYRLSLIIDNPIGQTVNYLNDKAIQYAVEDEYLVSLIKDYILKTLLIAKYYQTAIDLIQIRIDNPINEIDSLRAVLDLEIVLQLVALEQDKKPITTKYNQYKYPDIAMFHIKHEEHWDKLIDLLSKNSTDVPSVMIKPALYQNYPNPFNPTTTIRFILPKDCRVFLTIYNLKGQKVAILLKDVLPEGRHQIIWDGKDYRGKDVSSGVYLYRLEAGGEVFTKKMLLLK